MATLNHFNLDAEPSNILSNYLTFEKFGKFEDKELCAVNLLGTNCTVTKVCKNVFWECSLYQQVQQYSGSLFHISFCGWVHIMC